MSIEEYARPVWAQRVWSSDEQVVITAMFVRHYFWSFGEAPPGPIEGVIRAILAGDVQLRREQPQTWPLREVVPILREAVSDIERRKEIDIGP